MRSLSFNLSFAVIFLIASDSVYAEDSAQAPKSQLSGTSQKAKKKPRSKRKASYNYDLYTNSTLSYEGVHDLEEKTWLYDRPTLLQEFQLKDDINLNRPSLKLAYRLRADRIKKLPHGQYDLVLRNLTVEQSFNRIQYIFGLQTVTWGETLGIPIVDLVNPVDMREVITQDFEQTKIPQAMMNTLFTFDDLSLQALYIPENRRSPDVDLPLPVKSRTKLQPMSEYGVRLGYLTEAGFDLKLFHLSHEHRWPLYLVKVNTAGLYFERQQERVESSGISFSQAIGDFVIRGDGVHHQNFATSAGAELEHHRLSQGDVSVDYTFDSGNRLIGLHYLTDQWSKRPSELKKASFSWLGLNFRASQSRDKLVFSMLLIGGLGNHDLLFAPKISWLPKEDLELSIAEEVRDCNGDGNSFVYQTSRIGWLRLSYSF